MKKWKLILLVAGILLLFAACMSYFTRIESCYPPANIFAQYSQEYVKGYRESCHMDSPLVAQFSLFLGLFIPGVILFSAYWLLTRSKVKDRHRRRPDVFLLVVMFDSLLVGMISLLEYPAPGTANTPAAWAVESIAALSFLCYLSALALWHWKRWGLYLFQGASIVLATFILLSGSSLILAVVIIAGVIGLSLLMRQFRNKLS
jgi:hypothetical protein